MREIKFRAWDTEKKLMSNFPMLRYPETVDINEQISCSQKNGTVLMQFTGLKDKNGKEIYEGDIVRMKQNVWGYVEHLLVIEYDAENFSVKAKCIALNGNSHSTVNIGDSYALSVLHRYKDFVEIIGNIYENSELLK